MQSHTQSFIGENQLLWEWGKEQPRSHGLSKMVYNEKKLRYRGQTDNLVPRTFSLQGIGTREDKPTVKL